MRLSETEPGLHRHRKTHRIDLPDAIHSREIQQDLVLSVEWRRTTTVARVAALGDDAQGRFVADTHDAGALFSRGGPHHQRRPSLVQAAFID